MNVFYGLVPIVIKAYVAGDQTDEYVESNIDMICLTEESAKYMVQELNEGRFLNVPCFFGINCRAQRWVYHTLNSYDNVPQFIVWFDPLSSYVYSVKPSTIPTLRVVLHHHYAEGLLKSSS